ncbi:hypothetical protein [Polyangium sp. 15x6]|uniref:hypothetical protein n=1 Tax=Polyangium sp. 15x6 TaxID=3042687 RepID=UPI00249B628C|nr:hypothetical protein [Polyangium sp. 15x6]MDI3284245.1 hypothetical protein [Polyangium sp. 15x6]
MDTIASSTIATARHHFWLRCAERGLRADLRDFILTYAVEFRARGATHLVVLERRLPIELQGTDLARRARGWILLLSDDGTPLTCYRRFDATRKLRRKPKLRLTREQRLARWVRSGRARGKMTNLSGERTPLMVDEPCDPSFVFSSGGGTPAC